MGDERNDFVVPPNSGRRPRKWATVLVVAGVAVATIVILQLNGELEHLQGEHADLEEQVDRLARRVSDLESQVASPNSELRAELEELNSDVETVRRDVESVQGDVSSLDGRVEGGFGCEGDNWEELIDSMNAGRGGTFDVNC